VGVIGGAIARVDGPWERSTLIKKVTIHEGPTDSIVWDLRKKKGTTTCVCSPSADKGGLPLPKAAGGEEGNRAQPRSGTGQSRQLKGTTPKDPGEMKQGQNGHAGSRVGPHKLRMVGQKPPSVEAYSACSHEDQARTGPRQGVQRTGGISRGGC